MQSQSENEHNFDFSSDSACNYFKSSFAKSLMCNNNNQFNSIDLGKCIFNSSTEGSAPGTSFGSAEFEPAAAYKKDFAWSNNQNQEQELARKIETDGEVLRLRKECQTLVEENRRLLRLNHRSSTSSFGSGSMASLPAKDIGSRVAEVALQSQVDTLQWQLKQTESSRQMHRAVMEEVVRFLERAHTSLRTMATTTGTSGSFSKSQIRGLGGSTSSVNTAGSGTLRRRPMSAVIMESEPLGGENGFPEGAGDYSNFRDYTIRRAKRSQASASDDEAEKLSTEAFRLYRIAQSLLNTREPILTNSFNTQNTTSESGKSFPRAPNQTKVSLDSKMTLGFGDIIENHVSTAFNRKINMRESLSEASNSSNDNCSISSKITDENDYAQIDGASKVKNSINIPRKNQIAKEAASSTENESGFSSMNSFQEIGLPLVNSTMVGSSDESTVSYSRCQSKQQMSVASNSSLSQEIGLPINENTVIHRRWDSNPISSRSFHNRSVDSTFSINTDDLRVLWV